MLPTTAAILTEILRSAGCRPHSCVPPIPWERVASRCPTPPRSWGGRALQARRLPRRTARGCVAGRDVPRALTWRCDVVPMASYNRTRRPNKAVDDQLRRRPSSPGLLDAGQWSILPAGAGDYRRSCSEAVMLRPASTSAPSTGVAPHALAPTGSSSWCWPRGGFRPAPALRCDLRCLYHPAQAALRPRRRRHELVSRRW